MAVSNPKKVLRHELDSNHPCIPQSTQYNMLVRWKVCEERGQAIYIYIYMDIQLSAELSEGKFGKGAFFSLSSVSK